MIVTKLLGELAGGIATPAIRLPTSQSVQGCVIGGLENGANRVREKEEDWVKFRLKVCSG